MCTEVKVNDRYCDDIGDLRAALGRDPIMCADRLDPEMIASVGAPTDDECLCHVDHDATAASVGMVVDRDDCLLWRYVASSRPSQGDQT